MPLTLQQCEETDNEKKKIISNELSCSGIYRIPVRNDRFLVVIIRFRLVHICKTLIWRNVTNIRKQQEENLIAVIWFLLLLMSIRVGVLLLLLLFASLSSTSFVSWLSLWFRRSFFCSFCPLCSVVVKIPVYSFLLNSPKYKTALLCISVPSWFFLTDHLIYVCNQCAIPFIQWLVS